MKREWAQGGVGHSGHRGNKPPTRGPRAVLSLSIGKQFARGLLGVLRLASGCPLGCAPLFFFLVFFLIQTTEAPCRAHPIFTLCKKTMG